MQYKWSLISLLEHSLTQAIIILVIIEWADEKRIMWWDLERTDGNLVSDAVLGPQKAPIPNKEMAYM